VGTLAIDHSIELPADARSDEIALQLVSCASCGLRAVAVYEESRRGSLDHECVDHQGWLIEPALYERLRGIALRCPAPQEKSCRCEAHHELGRVDARGRWDGLAGFPLDEVFPMVLVK
jgi:hypothetical protein